MNIEDETLEIWSSYRALLSLPNAPLGDKKDEVAKQCSLFCTQKIIDELTNSYNDCLNDSDRSWIERRINNYEKIKLELEKL